MEITAEVWLKEATSLPLSSPSSLFQLKHLRSHWKKGKVIRGKFAANILVLEISSSWTTTYALYFLVLKVGGVGGGRRKQNKKTSKETYLSASLGQKAEFFRDIKVNCKDTLMEEGSNGRNSMSLGHGTFQKVKKDWDGRKAWGILVHKGRQLRLGHCKELEVSMQSCCIGFYAGSGGLFISLSLFHYS